MGEANAVYNTDKYACSLAKMIESWREIWNECTNGITDIQFPFGVVQDIPWIRWHQTFDVGHLPNNVVPKVFMAVTCDLRNDLHG